MSDAERDDFRQKLKNDLALQEEVEFSRLLIKGLSEAERRKKRRNMRKWLSLLAGVILLLLVSVFLYRLWIDPVPEQEVTMPGISQDENSRIQGGNIQLGPSGNLFITGSFQGRVDFGLTYLESPDNLEIFIASLDPLLDMRWVKQIGSPKGRDYAPKIAVDSEEDVVITGGFSLTADFGGVFFKATGREGKENGDFFISKYNALGRFKWMNHGGGKQIPDEQTGDNSGSALAIDAEDHIVAAGAYIGSPEFGGYTLPVGGPGEDLYLARLDPAGEVLWVETVTCNYMLWAYDLDAAPNGDIFLCGYFGHHNYGGWADFGGDTLYSRGGRDLFVAKYSKDGAFLWAESAGSSNLDGRDYARAIAAGPAGGCVVTGYFEGEAGFGQYRLSSRGGRDMFLAKYDGTGRLLWVRQMGGEGMQDVGEGIDVDADGNIFVTGTFSGSADFGGLTLQSKGKNDIFLAKYTSDGDLRWARRFGGDSPRQFSDIGAALTVDATGHCYVTGGFQGAAAFDGYTLQSKGQKDLFIIKVDPDGKVLGMQRVVFVV